MVLLDDATVAFSLDGDGTPSARITEHRQVLVSGERGRELATLFVAHGKLTSIDTVAVRMRAPDGHISDYGADDAKDLPAVGGPLTFNDERVLELGPPVVPLGSVVDTFAVTVEKSPELFLFRRTLGGDVPVEDARFTVTAPEDFVVDTAGSLLGEAADFAPVTSVDGGVRRYTWQRAHVAATRDQDHGYKSWEQHDEILVRLRSWARDGATGQGPSDANELSRFEYDLIKDAAQLTPALTATAHKITEGARDPRERAERLFQWTRDNIRYCAVIQGYGG
ncbi:MAG TPA: DUF3857 domain-containing protein, partial [Myxococcota bacterium]